MGQGSSELRELVQRVARLEAWVKSHDSDSATNARNGEHDVPSSAGRTAPSGAGRTAADSGTDTWIDAGLAVGARRPAARKRVQRGTE